SGGRRMRFSLCRATQEAAPEEMDLTLNPMFGIVLVLVVVLENWFFVPRTAASEMRLYRSSPVDGLSIPPVVRPRGPARRAKSPSQSAFLMPREKCAQRASICGGYFSRADRWECRMQAARQCKSAAGGKCVRLRSH